MSLAIKLALVPASFPPRPRIARFGVSDSTRVFDPVGSCPLLASGLLSACVKVDVRPSGGAGEISPESCATCWSQTTDASAGP
jgi:hypothetical protein